MLVQAAAICLIYFRKFGSESVRGSVPPTGDRRPVGVGDLLPTIPVSHPHTGRISTVMDLVEGTTAFLFILPTCGICDEILEVLSISDRSSMPSMPLTVVCFGTKRTCDPSRLPTESYLSSTHEEMARLQPTFGRTSHHVVLVVNEAGMILSIAPVTSVEGISYATRPFGEYATSSLNERMTKD